MIIIENLPGKSHPGKNEGTIHVSDTDCLLHPIRFKHCCHAANVHNILFPGTTRPIKYQLSPVRNKGTGVLFHSRIGSKADARGDLVSGTVSPCQLLHLLPKVSGILPSFLIGMNERVENQTETEIGTDGPVFQQIKDHIFRPVAVLFDTDSRTGNRIVVTADHPFRNGGFQVAQGERSADGLHFGHCRQAAEMTVIRFTVIRIGIDGYGNSFIWGKAGPGKGDAQVITDSPSARSESPTRAKRIQQSTTPHRRDRAAARPGGRSHSGSWERCPPRGNRRCATGGTTGSFRHPFLGPPNSSNIPGVLYSLAGKPPCNPQTALHSTFPKNRQNFHPEIHPYLPENQLLGNELWILPVPGRTLQRKNPFLNHQNG